MEKSFDVRNPINKHPNAIYPARIQKVLSCEAREKLLFSQCQTLIPACVKSSKNVVIHKVLLYFVPRAAMK
jgi:hypothetical protein